jgi:hypothetical protein
VTPVGRGRTALVAALGSSAAFAAVTAPAARDDRAAPAVPATQDIGSVEEAHRIATRALQWLASRVRSDGGVELTAAEHPPKLASTALTALAFMANGHTAEESEDGDSLRVRLMIHWLLGQASGPSGGQPCTCSDVPGEHLRAELIDPAFNVSAMHAHGYATWALAMAHGMSFGIGNVEQRRRLERTLQAAVHTIELAQNQSGGWYYGLTAEQNHEGSVTITALQALRAAKEAGLRVDARRIERAVDYLRKSQVTNPEDPRFGGFRYTIHASGDTTTFALTAASISSLNQTGDYDSRIIDFGIEFMRREDPMTRLDVRPERWPHYGRFYATQAYWQYRDLRQFRAWYPQLVRAFETEQDPDDGRFRSAEFGDVYATAMVALTLAIPFGYLPTFQR